MRKKIKIIKTRNITHYITESIKIFAFSLITAAFFSVFSWMSRITLYFAFKKNYLIPEFNPIPSYSIFDVIIGSVGVIILLSIALAMNTAETEEREDVEIVEIEDVKLKKKK